MYKEKANSGQVRGILTAASLASPEKNYFWLDDIETPFVKFIYLCIKIAQQAARRLKMLSLQLKSKMYILHGLGSIFS